MFRFKPSIYYFKKYTRLLTKVLYPPPPPMHTLRRSQQLHQGTVHIQSPPPPTPRAIQLPPPPPGCFAVESGNYLVKITRGTGGAAPV
jgi:hypothetical protein